jgi:glutamyl-tRNA synthetase
MDMTHIIRGDDHKINTFKQIQIYEALQWEKPLFAHIPLIHTLEGKKLSKRDNISTIDDYEKIGIMPDALRNYLMRLGWSYKDKEIFSLEESIKYFNLEGIGKSPSKLDMSRILSMNEYYIKNKNNDDLFQSFEEYCKNFKENINNEKLNIIKKSLTFLKNKAKTMEDIYNNSKFIINDVIIIEKAEMSLLTENAKNIIKSFMKKVNEIEVFNKETLEPIINNLISENQTNFKGVGQPLRIILTGSKFGPGIYDIIISLGKKRVLDRLSKVG